MLEAMKKAAVSEALSTVAFETGQEMDTTLDALRSNTKITGDIMKTTHFPQVLKLEPWLSAA